MGAFSEKGSYYDTNSLELMFMHVEDFRMFKETSINLNSKYHFTFDKNQKTPVLRIQKKENYLNFFDDINLNLKVLCGENGVGKTTIIDLVSQSVNRRPTLPHLIKLFLLFKFDRKIGNGLCLL